MVELLRQSDGGGVPTFQVFERITSIGLRCAHSQATCPAVPDCERSVNDWVWGVGDCLPDRCCTICPNKLARWIIDPIKPMTTQRARRAQGFTALAPTSPGMREDHWQVEFRIVLLTTVFQNARFGDPESWSWRRVRAEKFFASKASFTIRITTCEVYKRLPATLLDVCDNPVENSEHQRTRESYDTAVVRLRLILRWRGFPACWFAAICGRVFSQQ